MRVWEVILPIIPQITVNQMLMDKTKPFPTLTAMQYISLGNVTLLKLNALQMSYTIGQKKVFLELDGTPSNELHDTSQDMHVALFWQRRGHGFDSGHIHTDKMFSLNSASKGNSEHYKLRSISLGN